MTGCKVGPDFAAPDAAVAPAWLQGGDKAVVTERQEDRDWWSVYQDPVLDRLVRTAYDQNLSLMSAGTRVLAARAQLGVAIGEFYPQTQQLGAALSYNQASSTDPIGNPTSNLGNFWRSSLSAQIAWELDFWGKFRRGIESADAAYLSSIASYDDVLVTLVGDVASTYIGIRTLERQIAIAEANVVRQRKALDIARARFEGGTSTKLDVYQAENVLAATQATIPQLTAQLEQGKNALRVLLGMAPESLDTILAGQTAIPVPPAQVAVGIPADLLRRRPDLRAAELRAAAQSAQIGFAKADLFPAFFLTGTFGTVGSNIGRAGLDDVFSSKGIVFSFGPSFSWPVLNYGQITNNVRVQDAKLQSLLLDYQQSVLKAQQEVENGIATYTQGARQVADLRVSYAAANSALGIALTQYRLGTRDFTTVLTAEQNLYTAENNLAVAYGNYSSSLTSIYRALGGGWQLREGQEFVRGPAREQMRQRTDWGDLLPPAGEPAAPGTAAPGTATPGAVVPALPSADDVNSNIRAPQW